MTSPIGRDLLSGLTGEDEFDSTTNPALTPLQHSMQVGRALRRMGATPAEKQKPGEPAGFWGNAVTALKAQGKESLKAWGRGAIGLANVAMRGPDMAMPQALRPTPTPPTRGVGGFVGELAGRMIHPIDVGVSAISAGVAGPAISRLGQGVAQRVGRGLLGKGVGHAAEGAAFGAIENPVANTLHEGRVPGDSLAAFAKRRAFDVRTGAAFGAVLDPALRGGWAGTKAAARGFMSPGQINQGVRAGDWSVFPDPEDAFNLGKRIWGEMKAESPHNAANEEYAFDVWREAMAREGRIWKNELDAMNAFEDVVDDLSDVPLDPPATPEEIARAKESFRGELDAMKKGQSNFEDVYTQDALGFYTDIIEKFGQAGMPLIESDDDLRRAFKNAGFPDNKGFIEHIQDLYRQRKIDDKARGQATEENAGFWKERDESVRDVQAEIDYLAGERNDIMKYIRSRENEPAGDPIGDEHFQRAVERLNEIEDEIQRLEAEAAGDERGFRDDDYDVDEDSPYYEEGDLINIQPDPDAAPSGREAWKDEIDPELKKKALDVLRRVLDQVQRGGRRDPNYQEIIDAFVREGLPDDDAFIGEINNLMRKEISDRHSGLETWASGMVGKPPRAKYREFGSPRNRIFGKGHGLGNTPRDRPGIEELRSQKPDDFEGHFIAGEMGVRPPVREGPAAPYGPILGQPRNRMDPMGGFSLNEGGLPALYEAGRRAARAVRSRFKSFDEAVKDALDDQNPAVVAGLYGERIGADRFEGAEYAKALRHAAQLMENRYAIGLWKTQRQPFDDSPFSGATAETQDTIFNAYKMLLALADDVEGKGGKEFAQKTGRYQDRAGREMDIDDTYGPLVDRFWLDDPEYKQRVKDSYAREQGYYPQYRKQTGQTFFSDFGALDKGIDVLRKGARSFKKWREAMQKEGVAFDTAKQAKTAWRDTLKGYSAIFDNDVINVEKYALDVSGSRHLSEIAGRHAELKESQVEGKANVLAEARDFANKLGFEYDHIDVDKAKKLTGREIKYREIAVEENMKAMEQAAEMMAILPDDLKPEIRQFIEAVERQTDNLLHDIVVGAGQKGRDLNMLRAYSTKIESPSFWATQAKKHLGPETPLTWDIEAEIMKLVNDLKGTKRGTQARRDAEAALRGRVRHLAKRHWGQQLADLFKAAITPLGVVDVANFATNTTISGVKTVDQTFSSFIEKMVAPLFYGGRRTVLSPFVRGSGAKRVEALKNAMIVGRGTMAGGADPTLGGKFASQHGEITLLPSQRANHYINKYLDFHWRRFGAADAAQREYIMTLSLWNDAQARAINEGFKGKERAKRAEQLFRDPDVVMASRAIERAKTATFTKENQVADFLTLGRSKLTPGIKAGSHVAVPFAKTLANIAEMTIDYTPVVGLAKNAVGTSRMKRAMKGRQAGERIMSEAKGGSAEKLAQRQAADKERVAEEAQRRLIETLGRQMTGAGVIGVGFLLALQNKLTGFGPMNRAEREHWEAEGRQPMSVLVNGVWRRYDRIVGPMAPLLALGADAFQTSQELKRRDPGVTTGDRVKRVARGFAGTVVESAPGGSLTIFGRRQTADPEGSFLGGTATSALNVLGLGRVAEATDPFERRTENFPERLQSRIPGLRTRLPVKTTATGEPVKNELRGVAMFDPTRPRRDRSTPVLREMRRLGVEMTRPSDRGTYSRQQQTQRFRAGESETRVPEQYDRPLAEVDRIAELSGPRITERLGKLMNRSVYQRWDDGQKKRAIQSIMNDERARADRLVTREYRRQGIMPGDQ